MGLALPVASTTGELEAREKQRAGPGQAHLKAPFRNFDETKLAVHARVDAVGA